MIRSIVVDASVALSWLLPGEDTKQTLVLRDYAIKNPQIELLVPPIFWYEVANVLWVAVKRNRIYRTAAEEALELLLEFQFTVWIADPLISLNLSLDHNLAVYDSTYLAIALEHKAKLWTIDQSLGASAKHLDLEVLPR